MAETEMLTIFPETRPRSLETEKSRPRPQPWSELWCLSGGKRGDYQNCCVLYCVLKWCTVISTVKRVVLTVQK